MTPVEAAYRVKSMTHRAGKGVGQASSTASVQGFGLCDDIWFVVNSGQGVSSGNMLV